MKRINPLLTANNPAPIPGSHALLREFITEFYFRVMFLVNLVPATTESTATLHIVQPLIRKPDYLVFTTARNGDSERRGVEASESRRPGVKHSCSCRSTNPQDE